MSKLTPEEKEVAIMIAKGLEDKEIAKRLFISKRFACKHVQSIKKKWNVTSRVSIGIIVSYLGWYDYSKEEEEIISSYKLMAESR